MSNTGPSFLTNQLVRKEPVEPISCPREPKFCGIAESVAMERRVRVRLDITAHKEELNVTQVHKKTKVRVRYYVELVIEDQAAPTRTRMGFNGTFRGLLALHEAFIKYAAEMHKEESWLLVSGMENGSGEGSRSMRHSLATMPSSNSSSSSTLDASSAHFQPRGVKKLFQKLGLRHCKHKSHTATAGAAGAAGATASLSRHALNRQHSRSDVDQPSRNNQLELHQQDDERKTLLHDFPSFHKRHFLLKLEQHGEDKMDQRTTALFEYYTRLFNSEFCELLVDFFLTQAKESAQRRQLELQLQQQENTPPPSADGPNWRERLASKLRSSSSSSEDAIEFVGPVVTQLHRKSTRMQ